MINIKKGLDLPISGAPRQAIEEGNAARSVAVLGPDYPGMKPTMEVKEGDVVAKGQILFSDKKTPGVIYTAPAAGTVAEIKEKDIDIFTALIGSGPAYVFYIIESLLESSESLELPKEEKINLLASMIAGSANLAKKAEDSPESLRKKVTSPGGVTQRAIEEFEINNLKNLIKESMKVAEKKSIELGEG